MSSTHNSKVSGSKRKAPTSSDISIPSKRNAPTPSDTHPSFSLLIDTNVEAWGPDRLPSSPSSSSSSPPPPPQPRPTATGPSSSRADEQPPPEIVEEEEERGGRPGKKEEKFKRVFWVVEANGINPETGEIVTKGRSVTLTSLMWKHFEPISCPVDLMLKGQCNYCDTLIRASGKNHGTNGLQKHYNTCKKKPKGVDSNQTQLRFDQSTGSVKNWQFNQEYSMDGLCIWIVDAEQPFSVVDRPSFKQMMNRVCPWFDTKCRTTVTDRVYKMYVNEKQRLMVYIKENAERVCLTTDTWTSIKRDNYMALTAHFIDKEWKLRKRILNFCLISGHSGDDIAKDVDSCMRDWGITRILTITVDNAGANDTGIKKLVTQLRGRQDALVSNGDLVHLRCVAHIVNLVVQDGLKSLGDGCSVDRIRAAVMYVRGSPARYKMFRRCITDLGSRSKRLLTLDVTTRWNSTHDMLISVVALRRVFISFEMQDGNYAFELGGNLPQHFDWERAEKFAEFLSPFKRLTEKVSGTHYVTSNLVFKEICMIEEILTKWLKGQDGELKEMALKMKEKYDKYWGISDKMNHMLYYAVILDPCYKLSYLDHMIEDAVLKETIRIGFRALFEEYKMKYGETSIPPSHNPRATTPSEAEEVSSKHESFKRSRASLKKQPKSEIDRYLEEDVEDDEDEEFDILIWWRGNCGRYPILSKIARDVLSIPVSTVASESAFSAGGRVLDQFRSSLSPRIVQALICYQDWLRNDERPVSVEESLLELEERDKEFAKMGLDSTILDE